MSPNRHHPLFQEFDRIPARSESQFDINFIGSKVRHDFELPMPSRGIYSSGRCYVVNESDPSLPVMTSEDYLEWIDLIEAIHNAEETFVMIEAGAGYGRWLVNAAHAVRKFKKSQIKRIQLVGIEPDPVRFSYMGEHFIDNGISPEDHQLIQAGVSDKAGTFFQSQSENKMWSYGQSLLHQDNFDEMAKTLSSPELVTEDGFVMARGVECIPLSAVIAKFSQVDLLDCDLQGEELRVIQESIDLLTAKVKRLHIGTHSEEIERGLRELMSSHGWECLNDYSLGKRLPTPFGIVPFLDGIQTWVNPKLVSKEAIKASQERLNASENHRSN
ncbi:MAG: hypothetical protein JWQ35_527 [Bacteriovoracaceae bacterium]|nr:hypothetical protein [Bacteriovoracaceae bacterium]